ncbi:MAG: hypothetical protein GC149_17300 [Gammaproteobacteria bacterium]|nr:hypothetical protein [Gammaproteobacteria bacterium]
MTRTIVSSNRKQRIREWSNIIRLLAVIALAYTFNCEAGTYLLIQSGDGEIYSRFSKSLEATLQKISKENTLVTNHVDTIMGKNYAVDPGFDAIISAGIEASIAVSALKTDITTIMSMLPKESYYDLNKAGKITCKRPNCHVIFIDQPVSRQLQLLKSALPHTNEVAVIGSDKSNALLNEIATKARNFGITVDKIKATDETSILAALNESIGASDVLMAIPDPVVYNRDTARAILLSAFYQRIPLFAYSRSFVRAGATLGIYSTPEDIAKYVAEILTNPKQVTDKTLYPKYFTIDVNTRAAEALGITLPDVKTLENRLSQDEN